MTFPADERPRARADLARDQAWAIAVGGIGVVLFTALLAFTWFFATTVLLIFTGMLLGLGLNALVNALGRRVHLPHTMRLAIVCVALALLLAGVAYLGGATIAEQASLLSKTIKSQITNVRSLLENHGIDTSFFDLGNAAADSATNASSETTPAPATPSRAPLPSAGALASSGGAIVSQTLKLLLGTIHGVGNIFIVLFLGLAFAAQPKVYHDGLLFLAPARHRTRVAIVIDRIAETLERWLIAQIIVMIAVGAVTWIGLAVIGIPGAFILGIQAGLLAFIPTVGAIIAGVIVVLASLASGWIPALSAFLLFMGVHAMESYVLTPILQRQALDIPPATLFAFQILLGVVFGIWGLALALPLVAIAKVMIDHVKTYEAPPLAEAA
ncbi:MULTISPECIES: AI-2E family transporter [Bradyrhizobium]|uniref:AI-2E family transporter n=1 Tax=Bradyrhizobium TaxID=374 RepID=UPI00155ED450|nr:MULTISPECIES: AI-2E family transporter [Bradyrhizobium]MDD1516823.1 AI-2E family transporter [Bradyrhizobium sp. WBAH30]MDD1543354.1 AI-2E family transporter [Bradyrhizobium sp. WBAH41]MDD1554725.1 AI-2E family transporter [Bradyrhizobium sp. WBAH23]MDD1562676.1 AI-2E family transporter [Bradyrhizobium sp. WBAH33]MDD1588970.1 AI-2E family transporter [Bradyrhizobium sp. WBAH42]